MYYNIEFVISRIFLINLKKKIEYEFHMLRDRKESVKLIVLKEEMPSLLLFI